MSVIEITRVNVGRYSHYIGDDMAEKIRHEFVMGILSLDEKESPNGGMLWEVRKDDGKKKAEFFIKWFFAENSVVSKEVFDTYEDLVEKYNVHKSSFVIPADKSGIAKKLLKNLGFTVSLAEGDDVVVTLEKLLDMSFLGVTEPPKNVLPIRGMTIRSFHDTIKRSVSIGKRGALQNIEYLPMAYFDVDVSCYIKKDDEISGIMLFHVRPSGIISVELLAAFTQDAAKDIPRMMRFFVAGCRQKFPSDTKIIFNRRNQSTFLLSEKLFPLGIGIPVYVGERMEL